MLYVLLYCESTIRIIRSLASSTNLASQTNSPLKAIILDKDIDLHNKSQQSHLIVPYLIMSTYCPAPLSRHPVANKNVGIIGNKTSITWKHNPISEVLLSCSTLHLNKISARFVLVFSYVIRKRSSAHFDRT